jgi:diguanylate cyclase (GGDEF)-like protein/PAS domain S-box-containing protein
MNIMNINKQIPTFSSGFEEYFNQVGIGIFILKENMNIQRINIEALKIFGYNTGELDKTKFINIFHKSSKIILENIFDEIKTSRINSLPTEFIGIHKSHSTFPLELNISLNKSEGEISFTVVLRDISEYKKKEENLKYQAYFDQLTGIPNRTLLYDRAENALNQAIRANEGLAIIFIDLDGFKDINDQYGHEAGDMFLKNISQRFINSARKSDTVSRIGGDEFIILMPRIKNAQDASNLAERILESNSEPIPIKNNLIYPMTSIGISVYPQNGDTIELLLNNSDKAMYRSKKLGKNNYLFYENDYKYPSNN